MHTCSAWNSAGGLNACLFVSAYQSKVLFPNPNTENSSRKRETILYHFWLPIKTFLATLVEQLGLALNFCRWCLGRYLLAVGSLALPMLISFAAGGWAEWTAWSAVDSNNTQRRTRGCTSPAPANGGPDCPYIKDIDVVSHNNGTQEMVESRMCPAELCIIGK